MIVEVHMTRELCLWFVNATTGEDLKINLKKKTPLWRNVNSIWTTVGGTCMTVKQRKAWC